MQRVKVAAIITFEGTDGASERSGAEVFQTINFSNY
jgi:hypothetical protein